ncbi:MAG: Gfo/Idh/MocA family protein [Actinomycetota bacterium]
MPVEPLRLGILGAARISERAVVAPARALGVRLVAVAARDWGRAQLFAAAHGVDRVVGSYADLVADREVEAVYNPLANGLHAPWNLAAIAAGKHVLSEKPFASNAAEAGEVRDAGRHAGVVVMEGFHYRYHPLARRVHELLAGGELGELRHAEASLTIPAPPPADPRWSLALAGGALMDLGCYSLHALRSLAPWAGGEPRLVAARARERAGLPGVDESFVADLSFPSGATGVARCDMAGTGVEMTWRVVGSAGEVFAPSFVLPHEDDRLVVRTRQGERAEHLGTRSSYTYQLAAFVAAVREGTPVPTDADEAVATMTLVDACYRMAGLAPRPRYARLA